MKWQPFASQFVYVLLAGYFIFLTYNAVVSNYRTSRKIALLETEIDLAQAEEGYLENLNVYYGTNTYRELEARRKLGYKKPDEKVIHMIVDQSRLDTLENKDTVSTPTAASDSTADAGTMSNPEKWLKFILGV